MVPRARRHDVLVTVVQGIWTQQKAFSPKTAAEIVIENNDAAYVAGIEGRVQPAPTLAPPP